MRSSGARSIARTGCGSGGMHVIPVLDIRGGRAVHARGGMRERYEPVVSALAPHAIPGDAVAIAGAYRDVLGAREVYVADLDAIAGGEVQREVLARVARVAREWVDAGVATGQEARALMGDGVARVVVGLETLGDFDGLAAVVTAIGAERVAFSLDLRGGVPLAASEAFRRLPPRVLARRAREAGARTVIVLDLARVGAGLGPDVQLVRTVREELPDVMLVAGGGVRGPADLDAVGAAGADAALVATALHDGRLTRAELDAARQRGR